MALIYNPSLGGWNTKNNEYKEKTDYPESQPLRSDWRPETYRYYKKRGTEKEVVHWHRSRGGKS
jgi:hypothetical protein